MPVLPDQDDLLVWSKAMLVSCPDASKGECGNDAGWKIGAILSMTEEIGAIYDWPTTKWSATIFLSSQNSWLGFG